MRYQIKTKRKLSLSLKTASIALLLCCQLPANAQNLLATYALALQNDPVLKEFEANLLAVGESKDQSIAQMLPVISATAGSKKEWINNTKVNVASGIVSGSGQQDFWNSIFSLNLTQPVFHWDHWVQLEQSDNLIAQAEAQYQAEQQNLMVRTTQAYFDVLAAQDTVEFAKAEKNAIARSLEQAQQRFEVGLIAITDVYEAQAGFDQARADVIVAENNVDNAKEQLRVIIGDNAADLDVLGEKLPLKKPEPEDINSWSKNAEIQNLNIVAALNQAEVARKSVSLQRSGHYPTLDLVGAYNVIDNSASFGLRGDTQNIGLQVNVPIFQGGAVNSRTREAEYRFNGAKENLIQTKREVKQQVTNAYRGVITSISEVQALKATVVSGKSSLEATEAGFDVGTRTMVDALATSRNLFDTKTKYSQARYNYITRYITLKQSISTLSRDDIERVNLLLK